MNEYSRRVFEFSKEPEARNEHPNKLWLASCTGHTMNRFSKALNRKIKFADKEYREFAVNCFSLLLNCIDLDVSSTLFSLICFCFNSPKEDTQCVNARKKLQEMISERPITREENSKILFKTKLIGNSDENLAEDADPVVSSKIDKILNGEEAIKHKETIKAASPFTKHYLEIESNTKAKFDLSNALGDNPLFYPDFVLFLETEFMPYAFIWSSFIYKDMNFQQPTSHLTDSSIENVFYCRKNLIPSPVLPAIYINKTAYVALGQSKTSKRLNPDSSEDESDILEQGTYDANDVWKKKKQLLVPVKRNRAGFYQKPALSLKNLQSEKLINLTDIKTEDVKSSPLTANNLIKIGSHEIRSFTIKKPVSVSVKLQQSNNSSQVICLSGAQDIVCEIGSIKITQADMTALNSQASDSTSWLNDSIIEAYIHVLIEKLKLKAFVFSTIDATRIAYKMGDVKIRRHLDKPHILCGPVLKDKHWCLFMVNISMSEFIWIDPKGSSHETTCKIFENWCGFALKNKNKQYKELNNKQWANKFIAHPKQKDYYQCGIMFCFF